MGEHDREKGKIEQARGTVKENVGDAIGNEQMEYEGKLEKGKGEVREGYADVRDEVERRSDRD